MPSPTRRALALSGIAGLGVSLSGCQAFRDLPVLGTLFEDWPRDGTGLVSTPDYALVYAAAPREPVAVPVFDYTNTDPGYLRADIAYEGREPPGTIVVEPRRRLLYLVGDGGRATRYGIGVGPDGRDFAGVATVARRQAWPDRLSGGRVASAPRTSWARLMAEPRERRIAAGPSHSYGARGLYLAAGGREPVYVIHGTQEPDTIGAATTSGCVRLINQDVIHLAARTPEGTPVVVLA